MIMIMIMENLSIFFDKLIIENLSIFFLEKLSGTHQHLTLQFERVGEESSK